MSAQQLDIFVGQERVGVLGRSELQARTYLFNYLPQAEESQAISLTMPVLPDQYSFQQGVHPIF
ncbi:HipA N-terminal domain-containing protein [uncultured Thiothrix sp.]|jgi:serine/threonine-protein kinase HipA|uniref:HipA N-terminal domain-containing protein n=1 Tax=uncultured Thiothrix sp. TaxID=223185 RepID=UPI002627D63D|nr:HipA N-terminal domain-containing protein [uncultured Thiothrix sp.]HMT91737.1 HipA N-terminal domain-containing protein [Thiolinea sp.]